MNIDTSKIAGYADMTAEQKVAALEGMILPDAPDMSKYVAKDLFDKTASEVAAWKKKHNDLLSAEDRKKAEDAERLQAMEAELTSLRRDKNVSENKAKLIALGYEDGLATETAEAMVDGNISKVMENQGKFLALHDQKIKETQMKATPTPPAGGVPGAMDYDKEIQKALESGDNVYAATLMRMQQESAKD